MKVILIKDCKDGQANQVVEVSSGYGTNFLIRQGFAIPYNDQTKHHLSQKLAHIQAINKVNDLNLQLLKKQIEQTELLFALKTTNDIVHGSITRKQIQNELRKKNIIVDNNKIENLKINTLGITIIKLHLSKKVIADLKIRVKKDGK